MADHIPFIYTQTDCSILKMYYSDSESVRVALESSQKTVPLLPAGVKRWADASIDGLHKWPDIPNQSYVSHLQSFTHYEQIGEPAFQQKPDKKIVQEFVESVLDASLGIHPHWISVPQLPLVSDSSRNKINRALAESTNAWRAKRNFGGQLILPVVITHQDQINLKTERTKRLALVQTCFTLSGAAGVWVAESTLYDQEGSKTFEHRRFPALIAFHEELSSTLPADIRRIGGPYWGMNLVLWVRRLATNPAVGLGNSYQYHLPGGVVKPGNVRIALGPLRRWAIASPQLKQWLQQAVARIPKHNTAHPQFADLEHNFSKYLNDGRSQVAKFYKTWFDSIDAVPSPGKALGLYQDLSSAYVLGKTLPPLPKEEGTGRKPERVAKQLMLNCL